MPVIISISINDWFFLRTRRKFSLPSERRDESEPRTDSGVLVCCKIPANCLLVKVSLKESEINSLAHFLL